MTMDAVREKLRRNGFYLEMEEQIHEQGYSVGDKFVILLEFRFRRFSYSLPSFPHSTALYIASAPTAVVGWKTEPAGGPHASEMVHCQPLQMQPLVI